LIGFKTITSLFPLKSNLALSPQSCFLTFFEFLFFPPPLEKALFSMKEMKSLPNFYLSPGFLQLSPFLPPDNGVFLSPELLARLLRSIFFKQESVLSAESLHDPHPTSKKLFASSSCSNLFPQVSPFFRVRIGK